MSFNNLITTEMASHGTCATTMVIQVMLAITHDRGAKMKLSNTIVIVLGSYVIKVLDFFHIIRSTGAF